VRLTALDATVAVAALVSWHERHEAAASAVDAALARKALILPAPALVESYAILTSLPARHRLAYADAFHLLRSSFGSAKVAGGRTSGTWSLLRQLSVDGIGGAESQDALIVDVARDAGAKRLLTFRKAELERFAGTAIELVEPV
jgi:predicted nucleic acid-binding protein